MRILIAGDSLSLPRAPWGGSAPVAYEQTYPYLLRCRFGMEGTEVLTNASRARTLTDVHAELEELLLFRPTWLVLHVGIVDCAPRVFSRGEHRVLERIRPLWLRRWIVGAASRYRRWLLTVRPGLVYTPLNRFDAAARALARRTQEEGTQVLWVLIARPSASLCRKSPGVENNVMKYNRVLEKVAQETGGRWIDVNAESSGFEPELCLLTDGHHLNARGHEVYAELIFQAVSAAAGSEGPVLV